MMTTRSLVFPLTGCVFFAACVSANDPTPGGGEPGGAAGSAGVTEPAGGQAGTTPVATGGVTATGGDTGTAGAPPASCETGVATARLQPANLIVLHDRTGSMGDGQSYQPSRRWDPAREGFLAFVDDPVSSQLSASLSFFPSPRDGSLEEVCTRENYQTPAVELTSLASPSAFRDAFEDTSPAGGSPTLPALQGTQIYALTAAIDHPDAETVVVLVTDGQPQFWNRVSSQYEAGCIDNDFNHVASVAFSAYQGTPTAHGTISIQTYVIGISNDAETPELRTSLDVVAEAGGTMTAQMVRDADPNDSPVGTEAATAAEMQAAFEQIRDGLLTCDVPLPEPPSGGSLTVDQLNLSYQDTDGTRHSLTYSSDCADAAGWHYDRLDAPTKIELCSESCETVRTAAGSRMRAVFGCATEGLTGAGGAPGQGGQGGQAPSLGGAGGQAGAPSSAGGATASGGAASAGAPPTAGNAGAATAGEGGGGPVASGGSEGAGRGGVTGSGGNAGSSGSSVAGAAGG